MKRCFKKKSNQIIGNDLTVVVSRDTQSHSSQSTHLPANRSLPAQTTHPTPNPSTLPPTHGVQGKANGREK